MAASTFDGTTLRATKSSLELRLRAGVDDRLGAGRTDLRQGVELSGRRRVQIDRLCHRRGHCWSGRPC